MHRPSLLLFFPRRSKRSPVHRSRLFGCGVPASHAGRGWCRHRHCLCFSLCFNRLSVHRSPAVWGAVYLLQTTPFAFIKICAAVRRSPAVWGASGSCDHMCLLSGHEDNKITYKEMVCGYRQLRALALPARESRLGAPGQFRVRRSGLTGRQLELQMSRSYGFCFGEPLGADGRSARKIVRRDQTGRVDLGARRHNACYV